MLQPFARLSGRLRYGLAPWRRRAAAPLSLPLPRMRGIWSEVWKSADERLHAIDAALQARGGAVLQGGDWDRWDLQVRGGMLGVAQVRMAVEEHGGGRQMLRFRLWPKFSRIGIGLVVSLAALSASAGIGGAWIAFGVLGVFAVLLAATAVKDCSIATGLILATIAEVAEQGEPGVEAPPKLPPSWMEAATAVDSAIGHNGHDGAGNGLRELPSANIRYSEIEGDPRHS
jgi:hypothetical protein